jgi:class 3 adenylate cyclase
MTSPPNSNGGSGSGTERSTRSLRRSLALRLTTVALSATLLLGGFIFFETRSLLGDGTNALLVNQQQSQARLVGDGLDGVGDSVSVLARDQAIVAALTEFAAAFDEIGGQPDLLDAGQRRALDDYYNSFVADAIAEAGLDLPPVAELVPRDAASAYLQYHYVVANPFEPGEREALVEAEGDESAYRSVHAARHPTLDEQRRSLRFSDLLLVDGDGNVVYTAEKRADLGRNLVGSPFLGDAVSRRLAERLAAAPVGETVLLDFDRYPPALGTPTLFAAAAVYGTEGTIGTVVVEIPVEALNRITTSDGGWSRVGLGDTGEVYVVGSDLLMRSDSRLWLEDPDAYLEAVAKQGYPAEVSESIALFGTTALLQPVDTAPVEAALDGEPFVSRTRDYLGRRTVSAAGRVENDQLDWVVVAQVTSSEASRSVGAYLRRLAIVAAILTPLVALAGVVLAGLFTRPFRPVVEAADRIARGDLDVEVPDLGRNELGDVGRRLTDLAAFLRSQEEALAEEERETTRLLLAALPGRVVEALRTGERQVRDLADSATLVAVVVTGLVEASSIDGETAVELASRVSRDFETLAETVGLERVRSSADQHLFVAGLGVPSTEADRAAEFALAVGGVLERFAEETGLSAGYRVGISSGRVVSGMLSSDQLTYAMFGEPPQTALALVSIAAPGQILVDGATVPELGDRWILEPVDDLVDLRGEAIEAHALLGDRVAAPSNSAVSIQDPPEGVAPSE